MNCKVTESLISHGCHVENSTVEHSVIGLRSIIQSGCTIKNAMIMGSDNYEKEESKKSHIDNGGIPMGIGEKCVIENTIVDKNARIGNNCIITNKDGVKDKICEEQGYIIRSGIVVIIKGATIPDGTVI